MEFYFLQLTHFNIQRDKHSLVFKKEKNEWIQLQFRDSSILHSTTSLSRVSFESWRSMKYFFSCKFCSHLIWLPSTYVEQQHGESSRQRLQDSVVLSVKIVAILLLDVKTSHLSNFQLFVVCFQLFSFLEHVDTFYATLFEILEVFAIQKKIEIYPNPISSDLFPTQRQCDWSVEIISHRKFEKIAYSLVPTKGIKGSTRESKRKRRFKSTRLQHNNAPSSLSPVIIVCNFVTNLS